MPQRLSKNQRVALAVSIAAAALAIVLNSVAKAMSPGGKVDSDEVHLEQQLSALGGIVVALLVDAVVKDKRSTFLVSIVAVLLGAAGPWLPRMLPAASVLYNILHNIAGVSPAMFTFGVSFMVKATDSESA